MGIVLVMPEIEVQTDPVIIVDNVEHPDEVDDSSVESEDASDHEPVDILELLGVPFQMQLQEKILRIDDSDDEDDGGAGLQQFLISHPEEDVNAHWEHDTNALYLAVQKSSVQAVQALMQHPRIDPNMKWFDGGTLFQQIARVTLRNATYTDEDPRHVQIFQIIAGHRLVDVNISFPFKSSWVASSSDEEQDDEHKTFEATTLWYAVVMRLPNLVRALLQIPSLDLNSLSHGCTPLHALCSWAEFPLETNRDSTNQGGYLDIDWFDRTCSIGKMLLSDKRLNTSVRNDNGKTSFQIAIENAFFGTDAIVEYFLEREKSILIPDRVRLKVLARQGRVVVPPQVLDDVVWAAFSTDKPVVTPEVVSFVIEKCSDPVPCAISQFFSVFAAPPRVIEPEMDVPYHFRQIYALLKKFVETHYPESLSDFNFSRTFDRGPEHKRPFLIETKRKRRGKRASVFRHYSNFSRKLVEESQ